MALPLIVALLALLAQVPVADDAEAAPSPLAQALTVLAERPLSPELAEAYWQLYRRALEAGDGSAAQGAVERLTAWEAQQSGLDTPAFAMALARLANKLRTLEDLPRAHSLYERALAIQAQTLAPDDPDVANVLNSLSILYRMTGELERARSASERALAIFEAAFGAEDARVGTTLNTLASVLADLGDHEAALPAFERSLALREANLGPDHLQVGHAACNLAKILGDAGQPLRALPIAERSLRIVEAERGPDHPELARVLSIKAVLHQDLGDLAAARPCYERALEIRLAAFGPDHPQVGASLLNLASLLHETGDLESARSLLERSLEINESAYGPDDPKVATALNNLGFLLHDLGETDAARAAFERALALRETHLGPQHPRVADTLQNLANLLRQQGDPLAARPLHERSLAIHEAAYGDDHPDVGTDSANLAAVLYELGDREGARRHHERALAIREAAWGPEHQAVARSVASVARTALQAGRTAEAWELAQRLSSGRHQVRRNLATLTEGEAHLYLAELSEQRDTFLSVATAAGEHHAAYAAVLEAKGQLARLALSTRAQIRETLDRETLELAESLGHLDARLAQTALTSTVTDGEAHHARLDALRDERDGLERTLLRRMQRQDVREVDPGSIATALPERSAVVDLLVHDAFVPAADGHVQDDTGRWEHGRVSAWIVRSGEDVVHAVDLGPVAAIEPAIRDCLATLVASAPSATVRGERLPRTTDNGSTRALRQLLWDPLVPHLDQVDTLFVSPDGVLATVPFEVLQDRSGRFVIEDYAIVYPTDVASMASMPPRAAPLDAPDVSLLTLAAVDFGADPAPSAMRRSSFETGWGELPATADEAREVAALHARSARDDDRRLSLQGDQATEGRLRDEMPRHAILHLATHGFFQPDGLPSLGSAARRALHDPLNRRLVGSHPGLLSGLVLAGASDASSVEDETDDGYLTATEVTRLDLSAVELVVLSACETGLGRPRSGEGLIGLRRAFHMAGAGTVISSLWSVEDTSTSQLMAAFYRHLLVDGMGRRQALRAAQLERLEANRQEFGDPRPGTWAAFVLSGEWR